MIFDLAMIDGDGDGDGDGDRTRELLNKYFASFRLSEKVKEMFCHKRSSVD